MARHNNVSLLGAVQTKATIRVDNQGNYVAAVCPIRVIRGDRDVGDKRYTPKYDSPFIWSQDSALIKQMAAWEVGDMVEVKGTIATKTIQKSSICPECKRSVRNPGILVYINPIHFMVVKHCDSDEEMLNFLTEHREISNQVQVIGTLVRNPKRLVPMTGLVVTQYPIAINRKFKIQADAPEIKTDYPWVKSYGDNAEADRQHLHMGSDVFVDGCIQARGVTRHAICPDCQMKYDWKDNAMEIVPFSTEYLNNFYTDDDLKRLEDEKRQQIDDAVFNRSGKKDVITEDDREAGIDDFGGAGQ